MADDLLVSNLSTRSILRFALEDTVPTLFQITAANS